MADKAWTIEQALAIQQQAVTGGQVKNWDPQGPFWQWHALRTLDELENEYGKEADSLTLFLALRICANHGLPMPTWLSTAYIRGFDKVLGCRADSWDAAFGKPYPRRQVDKLRQRRENRFAVWLRIAELRGSDNPPAIDRELFETVGEELGIGSRVCSELYYQAKKMIDSLVPANYPEKDAFPGNTPPAK